MKKFLLLLTATLLSLTVSADIWSEPDDPSQLNKEHVIYATIPGMQVSDGYVVGAFIDGECRAEESMKLNASGDASEPYRFELRVKGSADDAGKPITFVIYSPYQSYEYVGAGGNYYTLSQTLAFVPEGTTGSPSGLYQLNLVKAESYSFTDEDGVVIENIDINLYVGDTYTFGYKANPEGAQLPDGFEDGFFYYRTDTEDDIINIDGTTITAISEGQAFVSNSTVDVFALNKGLNIMVGLPTVIIPVESITLNNDVNTTVYVGDRVNINNYFTINPENATNKNVTVTANNDNFEIIEMEGNDGSPYYMLNAVAKGTTVVTITSVDNPEAKLSITFTIAQHVTSITNNTDANFTLKLGETYNLSDFYIINPDDANNKEVIVDALKYSDFLSVSGSGSNWTVTALKTIQGAAAIVTSVDNPNASTTLYFDIVEMATSVTITPNEFDITIGEELDCIRDMTITVLPESMPQSFELSVDKPDIVAVYNTMARSPYVEGLAKGTATVTVTATDGSGVFGTFTVNVYPALEGFEVDADADFGIIMPTQSKKTVSLRPLPADALVKGNLAITVEAPYVPTENAWKYVDAELTTNADGTYSINLTAYSMGDGILSIATRGETGANLVSQEVPLHVGFEYKLEEGWNWMSVFSDGDSGATQTMEEMLSDNLKEARTQDGLFYNDPVYGYFGDFTTFEMGTNMFYKLKGNAETDYMLFGSYNSNRTIELENGWTWVPYNCEYDQEIPWGGYYGDIILSLTDGFAQYLYDSWNPSTFKLKAGQGYMFYTPFSRTIELPDPYSCEQPEIIETRRANAAKKRFWNYNPRLYNSIMPMTAVIEGYNTDDYTVGAFVGDECRGEGIPVKGLWFITVAGETGEEVSFRIYNKITGELIDVDTTVKMASILGSANKPVELTVSDVLASSVDAMKVDNNEESDEYYNLQGQRVCNPRNGIFILNGKKVVVK